MMFEKVTKEHGVHYSRYIASWVNEGGVPTYNGQFRNWLRELGLAEDEIDDICNMASNGKLELETSAREFMSR